MQRHNNFGACTYVLLTLLTFAIQVNLADDYQSRLTAILTDAVRLNHNRIISPILVQHSFFVAILGAKDGSKTQNEIERIAAVSGSKDEVAEKLQQLSAAVNVKNYFYVNSRLHFQKKFRERTELAYTTSVNFSDSEKAATKINDLVASHTDNQLEKDKLVVKQKNIDKDTTLLAVNIINFSADWKIPIRTIKDNGSIKSMYTYGNFLYGEVKELEAKAAVLPFKKTKAYMLLIFPNDGNSLVKLEDRLRSVDITKIHSVLNKTQTGLFVPGFRFQTVYSLNKNTLQKMKIKEALTGEAQFDDFFGNDEQSFVKNFDQFSSIKVDKNGVKLVSAASSQYELTSVYETTEMQDDLDLDENDAAGEPFFFYIIDDKNILAAGSSYNR